jgi:hypothetical protein
VIEPERSNKSQFPEWPARQAQRIGGLMAMMVVATRRGRQLRKMPHISHVRIVCIANRIVMPGRPCGGALRKAQRGSAHLHRLDERSRRAFGTTGIFAVVDGVRCNSRTKHTYDMRVRKHLVSVPDERDGPLAFWAGEGAHQVTRWRRHLGRRPAATRHSTLPAKSAGHLSSG